MADRRVTYQLQMGVSGAGTLQTSVFDEHTNCWQLRVDCSAYSPINLRFGRYRCSTVAASWVQHFLTLFQPLPEQSLHCLQVVCIGILQVIQELQAKQIHIADVTLVQSIILIVWDWASPARGKLVFTSCCCCAVRDTYQLPDGGPAACTVVLRFCLALRGADERQECQYKPDGTHYRGRVTEPRAQDVEGERGFCIWGLKTLKEYQEANAEEQATYGITSGLLFRRHTEV